MSRKLVSFLAMFSAMMASPAPTPPANEPGSPIGDVVFRLRKGLPRATIGIWRGHPKGGNVPNRRTPTTSADLAAVEAAEVRRERRRARFADHWDRQRLGMAPAWESPPVTI